MTSRNPLEVRCPICHASPNEWCHSLVTGEDRTLVHEERRRALSWPSRVTFYVVGTSPEDARDTYLYTEEDPALDQAHDLYTSTGVEHVVFTVEVRVDWNTLRPSTLTPTVPPPPEVRVSPSKLMNLNPEPLRVVTSPEVRCRKCGQTWGMRGRCVCLVSDPYEVGPVTTCPPRTGGV